MKRKRVAEAAQIDTHGLVCPVCGDLKIRFHSDAVLPVGAANERTLIFICSESHTFFVPDCSLRSTRQRLQRRAPRRFVLAFEPFSANSPCSKAT